MVRPVLNVGIGTDRDGIAASREKVSLLFHRHKRSLPRTVVLVVHP